VEHADSRILSVDSNAGHPEYGLRGVETTTWAFGKGMRHSVGMGNRRRAGGGGFNRRFASFENSTFWRWMRAMSDRWKAFRTKRPRSPVISSSAPVLDLRQQRYHHRRPHRPCLRRRCRRAFRGLRLARRAREGRQRIEVSTSLRSLLQPDGCATLVIVDTNRFGAPHKQDTAAAHGNSGSTRFRSQAQLRWRRRAIPRPDGCATFRRGTASVRQASQDWSKLMAAYRAESETSRSSTRCSRRASAGWDATCRLRADPGRGQPGFVRQGAERIAHAIRVRRRLGRSRALDKTRLTSKGRRLEPALRRSQHAFRHPRACMRWGGREWH